MKNFLQVLVALGAILFMVGLSSLKSNHEGVIKTYQMICMVGDNQSSALFTFNRYEREGSLLILSSAKGRVFYSVRPGEFCFISEEKIEITRTPAAATKTPEKGAWGA